MLRALVKVALPAAAVVLCVVPGAIGLLAAPRLAAVPETMLSRGFDDMRVVSATSRRGWFASRVQMALDLHAGTALDALRALELAPPDGPARLELDANVRHGPLPLGAPSRGRLDPALLAADIDVYAVMEGRRYRLPANVTLRGGPFRTTAELVIQPHYRAGADGAGQIRFSGLDLSATLDRRRDRAAWDLRLDELYLPEDGGGITVRALKISGGADSLRMAKAVGFTSIAVEHLQIVSAPQIGPPVAVGGLDYALRVTPTGERTAVELTAALASLRVGAWQGGDFAAHASLDIASDSYDRLLELSRSGFDGPSGDAAGAWLAGALDRGLSLDVSSLRFATPEGRGRMTMTVSIAPGAAPAPADVIGHARGDLTLRIASALVDALAAAEPAVADHVQSMLGAGWLLRDADAYATDVTLREGALRANGRAVPLPL